MKVAFIVDGFPYLSQTFILNQITGLIDMEYDVEIFAQFNPKEEKVHSEIEKYKIMDRINYFDMPRNRIKRLSKAILLIIPKLFYKDGFKIIKSCNIFKYGEKALSLYLFYLILPHLDKKYDIIYCHFGTAGILGVLLKEIGVTGRLITTFHGFDMSAYILSKNKNIYNKLFTKGDLFLPISEHWKTKLIRLGCDEEKIVVHHMGVNLEKFKYIDRRKKSGEPIKILTIGRLVEKKGYEYAIKAIKKIIVKYRNIEYIIIGDGSLENKLKKLVSESGIKKYIKFVGAAKQDEVLDFYKQAHIFMLPSITASNGDQEGIPVVLMEAQATGLPVISTSHTGIPEVVVDGKSGFLVPERDVNALVEKIEYLIEHPELWPKMGKYGRKFIEENYNIRKLNQKLLKIFQNII